MLLVFLSLAPSEIEGHINIEFFRVRQVRVFKCTAFRVNIFSSDQVIEFRLLKMGNGIKTAIAAISNNNRLVIWMISFHHFI